MYVWCGYIYMLTYVYYGIIGISSVWMYIFIQYPFSLYYFYSYTICIQIHWFDTITKPPILYYTPVVVLLYLKFNHILLLLLDIEKPYIYIYIRGGG